MKLRSSVILILTLNACTSAAPPPTLVGPQTSLQTFSADNLYPATVRPKCKALFDSYCSFLNSPAVQGNLEVKGAAQIFQGETKNQFPQAFYRFSLAKLRNRMRFPKDFLRVLERHTYFNKLKAVLDRRPRPGMNLNERLGSDRAEAELNYIWSTAYSETVILRMSKRYPEYHRIPETLLPIELQLERRRMRRDLVTEVSRAIWQGSLEWKKVEDEFRHLQAAFTRMIARLDVEDRVRVDWTKRIADLKLVAPGAFPAIANEECGSTKADAFYYTYLNLVTVCAGDFTSEDIVQTLAHEMAHALGVDRSQYLFEVNSGFGRDLAAFRRKICQPSHFTCADWSDFKAHFDESLQTLEGYEPEVPKFQACLMRQPNEKALRDPDVQRFSRAFIADRISSLASSDRFLRITKANVPLKDGRAQRNPNYLNPCSYSLWSQGEEPIDDELTTLMFFTAEYRCTDTLAAARRLRAAIETARAMSEKVTRRSLKIEGRFSARPRLVSEGFSSPPFERFADVLGSYAVAEILSESPDRWDRQNRFLATSSWACTEPSLSARYPEESAVEKEYFFDAHTEGEERRKESFTTPIREVIGCEKDFVFEECRLPFKSAR